MNVKFSPTDANMFYVGSTDNFLYYYDKRQQTCIGTIKNDSHVNSICVLRDGLNLITGDGKGFLKTWDIRTKNCLSKLQNDKHNKPISHCHISVKGTYGEAKYLAVNSFDNVLRVYEFGANGQPLDLQLKHSVTGHINANWPIRSSFFYGKESKENAYRDDENMKAHGTLLLATGSADRYAYLYDVGGPKGTAENVQRLEGHTDRVYAVNFHPFEPVLATCSADFSIKIWIQNGRAPNRENLFH